MKLDLPGHAKIYSVIHVLHIIPYAEQPKDFSPAVLKRTAQVTAIEGIEHVVENVLVNPKKRKGFQFFS